MERVSFVYVCGESKEFGLVLAVRDIANDGWGTFC